MLTQVAAEAKNIFGGDVNNGAVVHQGEVNPEGPFIFGADMNPNVSARDDLSINAGKKCPHWQLEDRRDRRKPGLKRLKAFLNVYKR